MSGTMHDTSTEGPYPRLVFRHRMDWEVIMCAADRFRLICDQRGFLGTFTNLEAAITYMNLEFLCSP